MISAPALLQANKPGGGQSPYGLPLTTPPFRPLPGVNQGFGTGSGPALPGPQTYPPQPWPGQLPPNQWLGPGSKPPQFTLNGGGIAAPSILQRQAMMAQGNPMALSAIQGGGSLPPNDGGGLGGFGSQPGPTGTPSISVGGGSPGGFIGLGTAPQQIGPGNFDLNSPGPFGSGYSFAGSYQSAGPDMPAMNWYNGPLTDAGSGPASGTPQWWAQHPELWD